MTRGLENETGDIKLKGLGCLLWRREEQGQRCKVFWQWRLYCFYPAGDFGWQTQSTSFYGIREEPRLKGP